MELWMFYTVKKYSIKYIIIIIIMQWECRIHPGCIWSCNCACENCSLYTKTYIDRKKPVVKNKKNKTKQKINTNEQ